MNNENSYNVARQHFYVLAPFNKTGGIYEKLTKLDRALTGIRSRLAKMLTWLTSIWTSGNVILMTKSLVGHMSTPLGPHGLPSFFFFLSWRKATL